MYGFESNASRKPLHAMVIGAVITAFVLFSVGSQPKVPYPAVFQLLAIVSLAAAVYLTVRYSLRIYRYAVEPSGITDANGTEQADLVITERSSRRETVVMRVSLRDITRVEVTNRKNSDHRATVNAACKGQKVFRYANTPILAEECWIWIPTEDSVVIIPVDEKMVRILNRKP